MYKKNGLRVSSQKRIGQDRTGKKKNMRQRIEACEQQGRYGWMGVVMMGRDWDLRGWARLG